MWISWILRRRHRRVIKARGLYLIFDQQFFQAMRQLDYLAVGFFRAAPEVQTEQFRQLRQQVVDFR